MHLLFNLIHFWIGFGIDAHDIVWMKSGLSHFN
jgi:hypothetical protein